VVELVIDNARAVPNDNLFSIKQLKAIKNK